MTEFFIELVVGQERALAAKLTDEDLDEMWHPTAMWHFRVHRVEDLTWPVTA
jgi:hypothetical protein